MLYPFDDRHRYHRPAALIASMHAKYQQQALEGHLKWLSPDPIVYDFTAADMRTIAALGGIPPRA